ncbi:YcjF family protein [Anaerocolumna chitinilytica]|uniref:GTPase n=1 Tax=Anaerocolumna chitinilytica TaxID=1727145 RepID=A0A7I8DFA4_9FIRM|nr:GTPase [Anaerocolumna chitinilytica]BCJ97072.1 GTPase [Anaerocolumna chitinilytica]
MELNISDIASQCITEINKKIKNLKNLNIIVAGKTGVGKSTLINYIFREQLAQTGIGRPVTQHIQMITKKDVPLTIYDTKGLELGRDTQKEIKGEIIDKIKEGLYSKDENKCIHCIWYCINTASDRIEEDEIEWIKEFTEDNKDIQVPLIIVLTKSFSKKKAKEFKDYIDSLNLPVCAIVPVLALDYEIDEEYIAKAYGGEELIEIMGELLGEELIPTLQNVQRAAVKQKVKYARGVVATTVTASFAEGFTPVPFADAALLVPTQVAMIASITVAFGLKVDKGIIASFITSILGTTGATLAGRSIVAGLFKLIPGAGTIIGGAISGGTAALITTALGEAYIRLMERMCLGEIKASDISSKEAMTEMKEIFKEELKDRK